LFCSRYPEPELNAGAAEPRRTHDRHTEWAYLRTVYDALLWLAEELRQRDPNVALIRPVHRIRAEFFGSGEGLETLALVSALTLIA
jgi:hypothetical protein